MVFIARQCDLADPGAGQRVLHQVGTDFLVANLDDVFVGGIRSLHVGPHRQQFFRADVELMIAFGDQVIQVDAVLLAFTGRRQHAPGFLQLLPLARQHHLFRGELVIIAHRVGNLGQIAAACRWHDRILAGREAHIDCRQLARSCLQAALDQPGQQSLVQRGHAIVVEARCLRAEHRHLVRTPGKQFAIALVLLCHVAQRILCTLAVELVDRNEVGKVEHVDLFELRRRAEIRCHYIHAQVNMRHDCGVALADAGGLDNHQIEAGHLARSDHVRQRLRDFGTRFACRQ